jgi:hypothetical protein
MPELARIHLPVSGLGIIAYSPFAMAHVPQGENYLESNFLEPEDIARHVNACTLTGFGTGGPGEFELIVHDELDAVAMRHAQFSVELGIEVRDEQVCFRDLYDLIRWDRTCPPGQSVGMPNGYYRIVAYTTYAPVGQSQPVTFAFLSEEERPTLHFTGAPELCG